MSNQRQDLIRSGLVARQKQIQSLVGDKKKSDKFMATAIAVANDYKLNDCHPNSIIDACVNVAQMNLDLSPMLQHAYLVPFKAKKENKIASVQLIISAKGYNALLSRTGWKLKSFIVNEADTFHYKMENFDESIVYEKNLDDESRFKYAVALALSPDNTLFVEVMNLKEVEKHRLKSSNQGASSSGVWKEWFSEMALKTVVKKLVKKMPLGEDIAHALSVDDIQKEDNHQDIKQDDIQTNHQDLNQIALNDVPIHNVETGEIIDTDDTVEEW